VLSREDNELLCRVGPGTPMGNLMREYWFPALPSREFPGPDAVPKRMRLLGENLVMFRDSHGRIGALEEACPHRGATLYFGRNEEAGLRCPYHGWKFDVFGNCMETPTEPADHTNLRDHVKAKAYPCREVNKMIWIYMGPRQTPPPFPEFPINLIPEENSGEPVIMMEEANYLQNMEGDLDTAHLDWLHSRLAFDSEPPKYGNPGWWNPDPERTTRLEVHKTGYGTFYSGIRRLPDGTLWHRVNQFIFPFHTMISGQKGVGLRSFVPLDDHHAMLISHSGNLDGPSSPEVNERADAFFKDVGGFLPRDNDPRSYYFTAANKRNDYGRDMELQRKSMYLGIYFVGNLQDRAMTELMTDAAGSEPIYDRTREHLGVSDLQVIAVRQQLLTAVEAHRDSGDLPANVDNPALDRIRSAELNLAADADWVEASKEYRDFDSGVETGADLIPFLRPGNAPSAPLRPS
jgi:phthalate 4,5-dioxygenase